MRAWHLDDTAPISPAHLAAQGIAYEAISLDDPEPRLAEFARAHGYVERDTVELSPATPNLDAICAKFDVEHGHAADEVRFVLDGEGIFDIRDDADRWMRVVVEAGDLIVVPAGRHHRFLLTDARMIRCARLFKDTDGWVPLYREA